ncbi:MAG: hypothetical protein ACUVX1_12920 [Chloroflexota bacterium]
MLKPKSHIYDDLADWIDTRNIASLILDALEEEWGCPPTLARAQELWYRACDALPDLLYHISRDLPDPANDSDDKAG